MELKKILFLFLLSLGLSVQAQYPGGVDYDPYDPYPSGREADETVQIALLLDVSGSMEGLLEQAKSQLWHIVNGIMWSYEGHYAPRLEIALYTYGQERAGYRAGYLQQVVPFTTDLDWVSEALWSLRTGGRYEYAGAVIEAAVRGLRWSPQPRDLKMIYIAGNEFFEQGPVRSDRALQQARYQDIMVSTIYCGPDHKGHQQGWSRAAQMGGGEYLAIDHNYRQRYDYYDPYDQRLMGLNDRLNRTYVPYGTQWNSYRQRQLEQDRRARQLGYGIACERIIVKSSRAYYQPGWDLVDAFYLGQVRLEDLSQNELPTEMQGMTREQQRQYLSDKARERQQVRQQIQQVAQEVRQSTPEANPTQPGRSTPGRSVEAAPRTLDQAIIESTTRHREGHTIRPGVSVQREVPSQPAPRTVERSRPSVESPVRTPNRWEGPSRVTPTPRTSRPAPDRSSTTIREPQSRPEPPARRPTYERPSRPTAPATRPRVKRPGRPTREVTPRRPAETVTPRQETRRRPASRPVEVKPRTETSPRSVNPATRTLPRRRSTGGSVPASRGGNQ